MDGTGADPAVVEPREPTTPPGPAPSDRADQARARLARAVVRYVPITRGCPAYPARWLRPDLLAALTSWVVMVPVALAYAGLAGVPPELGLTTAFAALAAYACSAPAGTSRSRELDDGDHVGRGRRRPGRRRPGAVLALTAALALTVGVLLLAGGLARLGFIADFLTKSVVTGFIFGLAITIIVGQLPKLLGVPSGSGSVPDQLRQLVAELPDTDPWTLAVGLVALVLILVLRAISRKIPGPLIALVLGHRRGTAARLEDHGVSRRGRDRDRAAARSSIPVSRCLDPVAGRRAPRASCSSPSASRSGRRGRSRPGTLRDRRRPGAARARRGQHRDRPVRRLHGRRQPVPDRDRRGGRARSRSCRRWSRRASSSRPRCFLAPAVREPAQRGAGRDRDRGRPRA